MTVVTNMAGRGTDIKLSPEVKAAAGLHVIILDVLESSRLERRLFGRAGRQGDPGSYDLAHALDEVELERIVGAGMRRLITALLSLSERLAVPLHFYYVEWSRGRLEHHRRKRRWKILKMRKSAMTCWLLRARGRVALAVSLAFSVFSIPAGAQNLDSGYCQLAPITDTRVGFAGREIVREVVVELGQRVARDDVLVRLDPAGLPARLDRARAGIAAGRTRYGSG